MTSTTEIPLSLLDRIRPAQNPSVFDRIASQALRSQAGDAIERIVDETMDRLERATGRKPKRSGHPVLLFAAGFASGVAVITVVTLRSRLWRRVSSQLRDDIAIHDERVSGYDDTELAHKVQSIVFRDQSLPKGKVSINAENGRLFLRGQVDTPDTIVRIERAARAVEGVETVENLLHVPGTPAPHPQGGALLEAEGR